MVEIDFKVVEHIAVLSTSKHSWTKELNRIEWSGRPAVYDIRLWSPDHTRCSKGVTLKDDEMEILLEAVKNGKGSQTDPGD